MSNRILVTGGAGYVGSHVVKALQQAGYSHIVVLDNLCNGFAESISAKLIVGDVQNEALLRHIIATEEINTVFHFAALTVIPESIQQPLRYYQNNTMGTLALLKVCREKNIKQFIFSSTAAIYGSANERITEQYPSLPLNPYGHSKLMSEQILQDTAAAYDMTFVILRYFNVAGASPCSQIGQRTLNATHLIKKAVQTALHPQEPLSIFGTDYPTPDGTCIRDYIHVTDLAQAHVQALHYLNDGGSSVILNCGYGKGYSVKEVLSAVESITGITLPTLYAPRREGDLPIVVADNEKIKSLLDWRPQFNDLQFIVKTAYDFEKAMVN